MSSHHERTPSKGEAGDDADADEGTQRRSERKRMREKQRRSDITNAFDELNQLTAQLEEPSAAAQGMEEESISGDKGKRRRKSSMEGGEDAGGSTRLDVIARALRLLRRLHRENEERKRIIAGLEARGGTGGGHPNDNVLVMVPSLTPVSDEHAMARASYPHTYPQSYLSHHSTDAQQPYHSLSSAIAAHDPRAAGFGPPPPSHHHHSSAAAYHNMGYGLPPPPQHGPHHLGPPPLYPHSRSGLSPPPLHHPQSPPGHPER